MNPLRDFTGFFISPNLNFAAGAKTRNFYLHPTLLTNENDTVMTLIDQIRDLIAEGETQRSLDELYKYVKESNADVIDHLVMLRSRMQNLERAVSSGTMDDQTAALERAKINEAILKLLPQLTPEYLAEASKRKEPVQRPAAAAAPATSSAAPAASGPNMKMIYMIGGGVLALILLILALSGGGDSEGDQQQQEEYSTTAQSDNTAQYAADNSSQTATGQAEDFSAEWQSNDGAVAFITQDGTNWDEMENDVVKFRFKTEGETSEYVEIYDASRGMTLRIFDNQVKFQQEGEWHTLAYGKWKE